ncbi:MAG: M56 family metallopeptidase [Acidobacteriota bacterium]|nr:M56 family metallopeptidase [Acidobacteriota bacterium]
MMEIISNFILTFLVNSLWQVTVVAIIAAGCGRLLLRNAHARFQHVLWVLALLLSVGLPLWSLQKQEYEPSGSASWLESVLIQTKTNTADVALGDAILSKVFFDQQNLYNPFVSTVTTIIAALYLLYLLFRIIRLGKALRETQWIRQTAYRRELTPSIESVVSSCQSAFGIKRVTVLCSSGITAPVTIGGFRPFIILPERLFSMTSEEMLSSALGHEIAHIKRKDFTLNLVYELLFLLISFHPAAALIKNRINETREIACDEMVAARLINGSVYARSLVNLADLLAKSHQATFMMGMMNSDILEKRIKKLVTGESCISSRKGKLLLTLTAFLLAASCGIVSAFSFNFIGNGSNKIISSAYDIAGTWQGTWQELPGTTLIVESAGDKLTGNITFYLLKKTSNGLEVADNTGKLPLIEPKFSDNGLSFRVKRRLSDDIIKAEMNFVSENEAVLRLESDQIKGGKSEIKMNRNTLHNH